MVREIVKDTEVLQQDDVGYGGTHMIEIPMETKIDYEWMKNRRYQYMYPDVDVIKKEI